jgi:hypothetical protein
MEGNQHREPGTGDGPGASLSLAERRERIAAAHEALRGLDTVAWQAPSGGGPNGLAGLLGDIDGLGLACGAAAWPW